MWPVGLLAGLLVLMGLFGAGAGVGQLVHLPRLPHHERARGGPDLAGGAVLKRSTPTRLSIPDLDVWARVTEVGLANDGSIAPPDDHRGQTTGWYSAGPTPGEYGSAVIVGHVDTRTEPAVFHDLGKLRPGQLIEVHRRDHRMATFEVESVETFGKTAFPAKRIFGDVSKPRLVLVTCGGEWAGGDVGYADNVVVFSRLIRRP
jgi:LPXTG-site transpeptidase (sortase) family protein